MYIGQEILRRIQTKSVNAHALQNYMAHIAKEAASSMCSIIELLRTPSTKRWDNLMAHHAYNTTVLQKLKT